MTKIHMIATGLLVGTLVFTGGTTAQADEHNNGVLIHSGDPVAGIELVLNDLYQNHDNAEDVITQYLSKDEQYDNLAFAKVTAYVNIRSKASEESEILGKLYNNSAATILSKEGDWYKVKSGSVKGYIKGEFLVTGEEAATLAKTLGKKVATVTTTTLKVRAKASLDAEVLMLLPEGDEFEVIKDKDDWIKISLGDNKTGYISADYVSIKTEYEEAISIEEEQERLEEESRALAEEANNSTSTTRTTTKSSTHGTASSSSSSSKRSSSSGTSSTTKESTVERDTDSSNLGSKIASYAVQFKGNPYVWGGTSLTNGADCSGFTQSVFAHFGISIPRTSRAQAASGTRVSLDNLKPGDLVFYTRNGTINHVAIYIGNGNVISASSPSTGIRVTKYNYRQPYKAVSYIK